MKKLDRIKLLQIWLKTYGIWLLFGGFLLVRLLFLFEILIDHDEYYTIEVVSRDWMDMHQFMADDVHVPLMFYIFKVVSLFSGVDHNVFRIVTVALGMWGLWMFFVLLKRYFSSVYAYVGTAIVGFGGFHVAYSQNLRMYALLFLLSVYVLYYFLGLLDKSKTSYWWGYVISSVLLLYTHIFGVFLVFYTCCILIFKKKKESIPYIIALAIGAIPFGLFMLYQVYLKLVGQSYGNWMSPTRWNELYWVFSALSNSYILTIIFIILFVYAGYCAYTQKNQLMLMLFGLAIWCVFFPMLISIYITPMFALRYFMITLPVFVILILYAYEHMYQYVHILWVVLCLSFLYHMFFFVHPLTMVYVLLSTIIVVLVYYAKPKISYQKTLYIGFIIAVFFFLLLAVGIYHYERYQAQQQVQACVEQVAEIVSTIDGNNIYTLRWLNNWVDGHQPTPYAHAYYTRYFNVTTHLVNKQWMVDVEHDIYSLSPPIYAWSLDKYFNFSQSGHVQVNRTQCYGVDFIHFSKNSTRSIPLMLLNVQ
ncbi:MAG: glycosyltransferase family 39 protein [Candidatus Woesearchaeota archaeon]